MGRTALVGCLLAGIVLAATVGPLNAEEAPLSLEEALELARRQQPETLAQLSRAQAQAARAEALTRTAWPRLSFATGWSRTDTPAMVFAQKLNSRELTPEDFAIDRLNSPDPLSHLVTTLVAEVPVDAFDAVGSLARARSVGARGADAMAEETSQDLRLRVVDAYRRAGLAGRVVEVAERALTSARARETDIAARVDEGAALRADLLRVRARRRQREADLAERRAEAQIARAVLSRALGSEAGVSYRPTDIPAPPPPLEGDAPSWHARALAARPFLQAANLRLEAARWSVRAEERASWPELSAWGQAQDDRGGLSNGARSVALGIQLRWRVLDPTRGKRVAAASKDAHAADLEARAGRDQVRLEVEQAWWRAQATRERYAASTGGAEEGREALRVVRERRQQGLATLTDELETETASLEAELGEMRAATEAAIADAALRRAAGEL
jgi:outer membrane protein TolC